jgi:DNA-binding Lrp family transcriptional regulator
LTEPALGKTDGVENEGQLLMTQAERDRLVTLKKAKKKLITQRQAAEELGCTERQVRRMLKRLAQDGDKSVIHGLCGEPSNRRLDAATEKKAVKILSAPLYEGFGPTLANEYLAQKHQIEVSKETTRAWMIRGGLWEARKAKVTEVHQWRPRRSRLGEMVQWDSSDHDWLEGRGPRIYLIAMIDDATSRLTARFAEQDSTAENMKLLGEYLRQHGRPRLFYTDKASLFQTALKRPRDQGPGEGDARALPPTQIGRALRELDIAWQPAHSAQAKGRVERNFLTAQDRLVKGLRVAGARTLAQANAHLDTDYLPWWEETKTVTAAHPDDAHRPLEKHHDLAATLCHVEMRQVRNDYTVRYDNEFYQIARSAIVSGLRGAEVRVEQRLDGTIAMRFRDKYLPIAKCEQPEPSPAPKAAAKPASATRAPGRGSDWNKNFDLHNAPPIWKAARASGYRDEDPE